MMNNPLLPLSEMQPAQAVQFNLARQVAERVYRLLEHDLRPFDHKRGETLFYVWPRTDRAVLIFDPANFRDPRIIYDHRLPERLAAGMGKRKVVVTCHEVLLIQVGYVPHTTHKPLEMQPFSLDEQPSPFHVPIGMTHKGAWWLSLLEMDSVLVGGARRMGKTRLLHSWILALLRGGEATLLLWDGKGGTEFGRYDTHPRARVVQTDELAASLSEFQGEILRRQALFQTVQVTSLPEYNAQIPTPLPALVLVLDEIALLPDAMQEGLAKLVAVGGAFGIHPVLATQRPDAENVQGLLKSNLATRISLPVPDHHTSKIILGRTGAEKLPKVQGRLLLVWDAKLVEAQAFRVDLADAGRGHVPRKPTFLSPREQKILEVAVQKFDGWFRIREVAETAGESHRWVGEQAQRWEQMGYLTPIQRNEQGHQLGRKITSTLLNLAGLCGSEDPVDRVDQVDQEKHL